MRPETAILAHHGEYKSQNNTTAKFGKLSNEVQIVKKTMFLCIFWIYKKAISKMV